MRALENIFSNKLRYTTTKCFATLHAGMNAGNLRNKKNATYPQLLLQLILAFQ